jgi:hypothetical protein
MNYAEWKLELIKLIINEKRIKGTLTQKLAWKFDEIEFVLNDDCDYPQDYKNGETPSDVWQGEIDAIADCQ